MATELLPGSFLHLWGTITGFILFFGNFYIRNKLFNKKYHIEESNENKTLIHYFISILALWLLITSSILLLINENLIPFRFNSLVGVAVGFFIGLFSFNFWALSEDLYIRKHTLGEGLGGTLIGCMGLFFHIIIGVIIGLFLG